MAGAGGGGGRGGRERARSWAPAKVWISSIMVSRLILSRGGAEGRGKLGGLLLPCLSRLLSSASGADAAAAAAATPPVLPQFDHQPKPYSGLSADEILQKRKTFLGPSLFYYYQKPVSSLPIGVRLTCHYGFRCFFCRHESVKTEVCDCDRL